MKEIYTHFKVDRNQIILTKNNDTTSIEAFKIALALSLDSVYSNRVITEEEVDFQMRLSKPCFLYRAQNILANIEDIKLKLTAKTLTLIYTVNEIHPVTAIRPLNIFDTSNNHFILTHYQPKGETNGGLSTAS